MGNCMDQKLMETMAAVLPEFETSGMESCRAFQRKLKKALRGIRRYDRVIQGYNKLSLPDRWVSENYSRLERAGEECIRELRKVRLPMGKNGGQPDLSVFFQIVLDSSETAINDDSVRRLIRLFETARPMTNGEHDYMTRILKGTALISLDRVLRREDTEKQAPRIERLIRAVYEADQLDTETLNEETNALEKIFRQDPAGIYSRQTSRTRAYYRYQAAKAAELAGTDEETAAKALLEEARRQNVHIGFPIRRYYEEQKRRNPFVPYYCRILFFLPAVVSLLLSGWFQNPLWAILLYLPCYEILRPPVERLMLWRSETTCPPRLEFDGTVPEECRTLVTIATLLPEEKDLPALREKLTGMYLANRKGAVGFCLLCDLKGAPVPTRKDDKAKLAAVKKMIRELNREFGERFLFLARERRYSKTQREYTGWERKRGAITELIGLRYGKDTALAAFCGKAELLYQARYLLALDYDTGLTLQSVSDLTSVAAHPMNRPVIDENRGIVQSGYGIFAPRMALDLTSSLKSGFSRLMGGIGGISSYDAGCAELYQDLFGEGIFTGKGLIDMEVYEKLIPGLFEEETLLSHDILEGCFLRTLFVGDVELTDGFPSDGTAFFKRMHRWIRGDFQNAPFLFSRSFPGDKDRKNPLSFLSRLKLFDNLRRALNPAAALILLAAAWAGTAFAPLLTAGQAWLLLLLAVAAAGAPLWYSLWRMLAVGAYATLTTRFYSGVLSKSAELLGRACFTFFLLPQQAWISLDGAVRGLYRRCISKRNMLEWVTAAQTESKMGKGLERLAYYLPQLAVGILLPAHGAGGFLPLTLCGIVFLLAIPLTLLSSRPTPQRNPAFREKVREVLLEEMKRMLGYYGDFAGAEDHYLPPDNVQQSPVRAVAHRTSPTNIGLMLLSYLTACDFGILTSEELAVRVSRVLATLEKLEKFHGNLYNWYDTQTLAILPPGFVSAVDSGNLVCCLTALKEGLRELSSDEKEIPALICRIETLIRQTDLSVFYDKKRNLFSIGWNSDEGGQNPSHYDMLMSESRMLSYFAVARGEAPLRHWGALSRVMSRSGVHTGPISWTGTMFEYFMPELLLHCPRGSLGYEGLSYCIACQKARTRKSGIPWGISESGIYAFDTHLNYQYSPNGVQKLALKRGMDRELVISPYSSYLVMSRDPAGAFRNLERLRQLGAFGTYGFYEAVDYTPSRVGDSRFQIVKSQMAHHLGMSIVALGNALGENRMQKRFLRDKEMNSAKELLSEKLSVGEIVLSDYFKRKRRERELPLPDEAEYVGHLFPQQPKVKLLSNPDMTCVLTDIGASYLRCGKTDITRRPSDLLRNAIGSFCFIHAGKETYPLTFAPAYRQDVTYETAFSPASVIYTARGKEFSATTQVRLHRSSSCEQRTVTLQNPGNTIRYTLLFYLEPSLFPREDDESHKSFSKLFLSVERDEGRNCVTCARRRRGKEELFALAAGFREDVEWELISSREELFSRPNVAMPRPESFTGPLPENGSGLPDPCIALRVSVTLRKNQSATFTLLTSVGRSRSEAAGQLVSARRDLPLDSESSARSYFPEGSLEQRIAQSAVPQILFRKRDSSGNLEAISKNRMGADSLWPLGISGDFPILLCELRAPADMERANAYAACHALLKLSFVDCDLVFLYEGGEETRQAAEAVLAHSGQPGGMGARAGIHLVSRESLSPEQKNLLFAAACHIATRALIRIEAPARPYQPVSLLPANPAPIGEKADFSVEGGWFTGESFFTEGKNRLPWCHILANPTFGTLLSDRGLGFTWAVNSRQNKLTPWYNDPMRDNRGEMLLMRQAGVCHDLVNGARAEFNPRYARYHGIAGGLEYRLTVRVPARGMIKYLELELYNPSKEEKKAEICYYTEPCLHVTRDEARLIVGERRKRILLLHNPFNRSISAYMGLWADSDFEYACDRPSFLCGRWKQNLPPPAQDLCAALTVSRQIPPGGRTKVSFRMAFAVTADAVEKLIGLHPDEEFHTDYRLTARSNNPAVDVMVNTWLPWQTLASRIWGRTGFYQNGGAYGFRDQLQDVISILPLMPKLARTHIIRCCGIQFEAGDVMHWWHPLPRGFGGIRGVRTRYSDDLIWLAWAVGSYVEQTGDTTVLDVSVDYLKAEELEEGQKDAYIEAIPAGCRETVWEHCKRALRRGIQLGRHGLPKMGGGDWNDGYNQVGFGGEGESVWLAQFLSLTLRKAAGLAEKKCEPETAAEYRKTAEGLLAAADRFAWDGKHYLRAFYDDGTPMGSDKNDECRIDSLPQSFAVLSGMPDQERLRSAMGEAYRRLVDEKHGIIRLFDPPFSQSPQNPGYVKSYPVGVRENGGQYTHAAVWFAMAAARLGMETEFLAMTRMLNPAERALSPGGAEKYGLEPCYIAADIYTNPDGYGRGGWSMYTGSAGWFYRLLIEDRMGFSLKDGTAVIKTAGKVESFMKAAPQGALTYSAAEQKKNSPPLSGRPVD